MKALYLQEQEELKTTHLHEEKEDLKNVHDEIKEKSFPRGKSIAELRAEKALKAAQTAKA